MAAQTFTTVAIPDELIAEVDKVVKLKKMGFRSRPEVIKAAVRRFLMEIKD